MFTPGVRFFTHIWGIYDLGVASLHTRCRNDIDERATNRWICQKQLAATVC